uniref:non-specific serine/threonine protein kinase n=1 Tax=Ganoderma boninense TaxID=34458 RepID=A0A5K1JSB2_9APHY|nr:GlcNAc-PI de-N-acetylase [Ganoderma boninense]
MTDTPSSSDTRRIAGSNPPPWALAEIRDDSRSLGDRYDPLVTSPSAGANASSGSRLSSKPSRMVQPSDFHFGKELGSGSWSTVMEATHVNTGKLYAVKILSKAQLIKLKKVKYATVEKDALMKHHFVSQITVPFPLPPAQYMRTEDFVLDLAPHGDLADLVKKQGSLSLRSDIWAIGCTLYFMVAGTPAFAAINDYQSFRKIEALDYSFPDGFYDLAKDFVQRLVVLDPSERLGVEPKSSPSQLREHPLFTEPVESVASGQPGSMPISWDTLWIDPPVCPETGIVQPAPTAALPDDEDDSLWDNVVHEFSLVNLNTVGANGNAKGSGGPHSPTSLLLPTGPPLDVPPDVVPAKARGAVEHRPPPTENNPVDTDSANKNAQDVSDTAVTVPPPVAACHKEPARGDLGDADDPALKGKDWSGVLATGETVRCVSSVKTPVRRGLYKHPRPCALILTTGPRVLCVPLDDADKASKKLEAKHAFAFPNRPISKSPPKGEKVLAGCKADSEQRKLILLTGEKEYAYEFSEEAALLDICLAVYLLESLTGVNFVLRG